MTALTVARIIDGLCDFYVAVIFIYILMSWIPHERGFVGELYNVLGSICEPYLRLFRAIMPPVGGIDFSPIIAVVVLELVVRLLVGLIV